MTYSLARIPNGCGSDTCCTTITVIAVSSRSIAALLLGSSFQQRAGAPATPNAKPLYRPADDGRTFPMFWVDQCCACIIGGDRRSW